MAMYNAVRPEPSNGHHEDHVNMAIICALPREFDAVEACLDEIYQDQTPKKIQDSNFYKKGRIGPFNIVLACLPEMGKESAASAASSLRTNFPTINLALVVGICGGVPFPSPDTEIILGDVIISHKVVKSDYGRQYPDRFEPRGGVQDTLDRSNREIRSLISGLRIRSTRAEFLELHSRYLDAIGEKDPLWKYPGVDQDCLFSPSSPNVDDDDSMTKSIQRKRLAEGEVPKPQLHIGPIASSDTVMKSAAHRDDLARRTQIIGFEMEGSGVCNDLSCIVIKGVCDYADFQKNKIWQDYAAASAACAAKSFLGFLATNTGGWRVV